LCHIVDANPYDTVIVLYALLRAVPIVFSLLFVMKHVVTNKRLLLQDKLEISMVVSSADANSSVCCHSLQTIRWLHFSAVIEMTTRARFP